MSVRERAGQGAGALPVNLWRARAWNVGLVGFELAGAAFLHAQGWSWSLVAVVFGSAVAAVVVAVLVMLLVFPARLQRRHQQQLAAWAQQSVSRAAEVSDAADRVVQLRQRVAPAQPSAMPWDSPKDAA